MLDYAMQGGEGTENCSKFIEFLGLRSLFPLFMKVRFSRELRVMRFMSDLSQC